MQAVKVRVRKPTRVLTFLSNDLDLRREDRCIVRSDRGLEYGICLLPPEPAPPDLEKRHKMQIVRKATDQDESTLFRIMEEERAALEACKHKIEERKLPMKLVDAEYTFDKNKIVFYFTAADRVDFRQLVRDLAHELKTRIELRHIQVRDEAKIVGGLGVCGRELCCSTWLAEFKPISMKMAKRQNLSLNPSKISGQCGRLLCCLSYENELYGKRKMRDPEEAEAAQKAAAGYSEDEVPEAKLDDAEPSKRQPEEAARENDKPASKPEQKAEGQGKRRGGRRRGRRRGDDDKGRGGDKPAS